MRSFARHLTPLDLPDADHVDVEEWLARFDAARTRHAYLSDLAVFYRWALKRRLLTSDPTAEVDSERLPRLLPRPVPPSLIPPLIAAATDPRVKLCLALAAFAGLRRAELAALTTGDISAATDPPVLVVRNGKGGKDRIVPLHPVLVAMLAERRVSGKIIGWRPDTIGKKVADHLRYHGVDATCHQLRHTFGTELARVTTGNIVLVQHLMGHGSISTTMGYVGWAGGEGHNAIAALYPAS